MTLPKVLVCRAKHCTERAAAGAALLRQLDGVARVQPVRCQKICKGPVVGVCLDGRWEWFRRIRGPKSRQALLKLVTDSQLGQRLERRRARGHSGKRR
jgi:hypothetical protein